MSLVRCEHCGSPVSSKRLQRHIARVHRAAREVKRRPLVAAATMDRAMRLLELSAGAGLVFLKKIEATCTPEADVTYNIGVALLRLDRPEEAVMYFEKTLVLEKEHELARADLEMTKKALKVFSRENTEKDLEEMGGIANTARDAQFFELALRLGNAMLKVDTKKAGSLNDLGLTYQKQEKYDKAIEFYKSALEVERDMFEALSNKAICMLITNRQDESYALYSRCVQLRPDFLQGWYHLGLISLDRMKYGQAADFFDRAIALNDEYYLAWIAKYEVLNRLGKYGEAEECILKAMEINPGYVTEGLLHRRGSGRSVYTTGMRAKEESGQADRRA
jgi:tetratricopeptide (TPR) repeat protein